MNKVLIHLKNLNMLSLVVAFFVAVCQPAYGSEKRTLCEQFAQKGAGGRGNMWMTDVQGQVHSTKRGCLVIRHGQIVFACYLPKEWEGKLEYGDTIRYDHKDLECRIHEVVEKRFNPTQGK